MSSFAQLDDRFSVSPQIVETDVGVAQALGFTMIVNNRPEQESPDQAAGAEIEAAARAAGLQYRAIPVTHAGFNEDQVEALIEAIQSSDGPILAYCRSGTRSTLLWALTQAKLGMEPTVIAKKAQAAGYDVAPLAPTIEMLFAQAQA